MCCVLYHMMTQLCTKVTVYGFGVEGLGKFSRGLDINAAGAGGGHDGEKRFTAGGENLTYHYFHGLGARKEGNDVHSFDTEERTFAALGGQGHWEFCKFRENGGDYNWKCGCAAGDAEQCRPLPLQGTHEGMELELDCHPGKDCPEVGPGRYRPPHHPTHFGTRVVVACPQPVDQHPAAHIQLGPGRCCPPRH